MKKYFFTLIIILFSIQSCKRIDKNKLKIATTNGNLKKTIENDKRDTLLIGDYLISQKKIVKNINATCITEAGLAISDSYKKRCTYYKIKFPYESLNSVENKVIQNFKGINYSIKKSKETSDADDYVIKNLIIQKEGILTDSIRIYSYESYIEALVQKKEYYYLHNNNLWILKFNIDEDGIKVVNWDSYTINNKGKIAADNSLIKSNSIVYAQVETYLNVRSAPNSNGEIIVKAYPEDGLKVLEVLEGWVKIELNGKEGYVSSDYVK